MENLEKCTQDPSRRVLRTEVSPFLFLSLFWEDYLEELLSEMSPGP